MKYLEAYCRALLWMFTVAGITIIFGSFFMPSHILITYMLYVCLVSSLSGPVKLMIENNT